MNYKLKNFKDYTLFIVSTIYNNQDYIRNLHMAYTSLH